MKIYSQKGFSLIELLSVMVIVGVVAGISIYSISGEIEFSKINKEYEIAHAILKKEIDRATYSGNPAIVKITNENVITKRDNRLANYCMFNMPVTAEHMPETEFNVQVFRCNNNYECNFNATENGICILPGGNLQYTYLVRFNNNDNSFKRWLTAYSTGMVERGIPQNSERFLIK